MISNTPGTNRNGTQTAVRIDSRARERWNAAGSNGKLPNAI